MYRNELSFIEEKAFAQQMNLEHLDLSTNKLTELNVNLFHKLHKLTYLDVSYNLLKSLDPAVFNGLFNLRDLNLVDSGLAVVHSSLVERLSSLKLLYLSRNQSNHSSFDKLTNNDLKIVSID